MFSKIGKNQKKVLNILRTKKNFYDIISISKKLNLFTSQTKVIINSMEKKNIIKTKGDIFESKKIKFEYTFKSKNSFYLFFDDLQKYKTFKKIDNTLIIELDFLFIKILTKSFSQNKYLINSINTNLFNTLKINIDYEFLDFKTNFFNWSEQKYKIAIKNDKILMIDINTGKTVVLKSFLESNLSFRKYKRLCEMIIFFRNSISNLNSLAHSIKYRNFFNA